MRFSDKSRAQRVKSNGDPDWLHTDGKRYNDLEMLDDLDPGTAAVNMLYVSVAVYSPIFPRVLAYLLCL